VLSDEVSGKTTYDRAKHYRIAVVLGMRQRTLVVNSLSKTYAMTGSRVVTLAGQRSLLHLSRLRISTPSHMGSLAQYAAVAVLKGSQYFVNDTLREFDDRRNLVCRRLNDIGGSICALPKVLSMLFQT